MGLKMYLYADYAIGHASKRNNILNIKDYKLNGIITDCYRSIFLFDEGLKEYVERTKSIKGYAGKHISDSLVFDFDGDNLDAMLLYSESASRFLVSVAPENTRAFGFILVSGKC